MQRKFCNAINLVSEGMSFSEEIKIIAFRFFKSKGDGWNIPSESRKSTFKIRKHGVENLIFLFKFRFLLKYAPILKAEQYRGNAPKEV